jgi:glutamate formiminotransferase/formiminotetrahydrofolate cyclodeaminase
MSKHKGAHPRLGAMDVCPFIPITGVSDQECIETAHQLAQRISRELNIPVYLYGKAAQSPEREKLPDIRQGEYESLPQKLLDPHFQPDYGEPVFNAKSGATVVGVRDFMLAYNVNLNTRDRGQAQEIALRLRESGRAKRDKKGNIIYDDQGNSIKVPGKLKQVQAAGWYIDQYGYAQVSMNLHNLHETPLHTAFEAVCIEAASLGLRVTGSEIVGMTPLQALLEAGLYYLRRQGKHTGQSEAEIIHTAILSLGLNDTAPFNPRERIIEYAIREKQYSYMEITTSQFVESLAKDSPTPGGGSVSALSGALSAALSAMVAGVTFANKEYKRRKRLMEELAVKAQQLIPRFSELVDEDSRSFDAYMSAVRLPKKTEEEIRSRQIALEKAARQMTETPLETLRQSVPLIELAEQLARQGNVNALSDAGVAALQAAVGAKGAYYNIRINLPQINDESLRLQISQEAESLMAEIDKRSRRIARLVKGKIG